MKIKEIFKPSLLISEVFYPLVDQDDQLVSIIGRAVDLEYYRGIEIGAIYTAAGRKAAAAKLQAGGVALTSWATRDLAERNLMPASLDPDIRRQTVSRLKELLDMAAECGAGNFCLISGPDPGAGQRDEAKDVLFDTLCRLSDYMKQYQDINLMLEPLDRFAHKKGLIGPTGEAVDFMRRLRTVNERCYFSWDSAHVALNEEELSESIRASAAYIGQIHLANAVLDPQSGLYGDWHMDVGAPGFLTADTGAGILSCACRCELPGEADHYVSIEARGLDGEDLWGKEKRLRAFLEQILEKQITD